MYFLFCWKRHFSVLIILLTLVKAFGHNATISHVWNVIIWFHFFFEWISKQWCNIIKSWSLFFLNVKWLFFLLSIIFPFSDSWIANVVVVFCYQFWEPSYINYWIISLCAFASWSFVMLNLCNCGTFSHLLFQNFICE